MAQADLTRVASNIGALNSLWALQRHQPSIGYSSDPSINR